jgi:hypothetical protein
MLPLLLALLAAPGQTPEPTEAKIFGDWAVACDNNRRCEMTSLFPGDGAMPEEGSGYDGATFSVERAAGPDGGFTVEVDISADQKGETSVRVDGQVIAGGTPKNNIMVFTGADAAKIVAAMINGKELSVTDIGGGMIGRTTLSGSSAALRFIDAGQGRAGTVTAAVAKGSKPASAVPAATAGPVVRYVRPGGSPAAITKAMRAAMEKQGDCAGVYEGGEGEPPAVEAYALGGGKTLALVPCGSGAYNYNTVPFIISGGAAVLAKFDYRPGETDASDGMPILVNAGWDAKTAQLGSYDKGRGLGDCGAAEDYVWDGTMFRLVEARAMPDCRGSVNWLAVWRAASAPQ